MRDLLVVALILASMPFCFRNSYFGVLMWYWVSYFNPHRFCWSFAHDFPVALLVALPTVAGTLFARKSMRSLVVRESVCLTAVWIWFFITYINAQQVPFFAGHMASASYEMSHISKILLMTFVTFLVINSRDRLRGMMLVSAGSLGLLAVRGVVFGLRTAGQSRVLGPPDSFLGDNNGFAMAVNMAIPMLFFLIREEHNRYIRWFLRLCFPCAILSVLLTYSRGGLMGLSVVLMYIMLASRKKVLSAFLIVVTALLFISFAPEAWIGRMGGFLQGNLDSSAHQRLVAWQTAWNFSHDYPIAGGGFDTLVDVNVFRRYQLQQLPEGYDATSSHSIYFQVLVDHGFVGLILFFGMFLSCLWSLFRIRRTARGIPTAKWLVSYADMILAAMLGFMTNGLTIGFVYLDVIYQMIATVVVLKVLFRDEVVAFLAPHANKEASQLAGEEIAVPA